MTFHAACRAAAPAIICRHSDVLLYLLPSAALAVAILILARKHPFFFLFTAAGTVCHEAMHFLVGLITGARPTGVSIIPVKQGSQWLLGSVTLTRVRWYNAAPAALAPLLIILIPFAVASWRTGPGWTFQLIDVAIAFALAPQFLSFWPSRLDWRIALRSWPYLFIIAALVWLAAHYGIPKLGLRL